MTNARNLFIVFLSLLVFEIFSQSAVCAYRYRKRITIDPSRVSGSSDLTNFPMLINITADPDLETVATFSGHVESSAGFDIIFTAADGVTRLDHQLEKYTASSGELVAWVRIPILSTTFSTTIYMYYGNSAATGSDQSVNTTWNSSYEGVWHFHNSSFTDNSGNGNNGTNSSPGSTNNTASKIDEGRTFPGTNTNYVQLPMTGMSGGSGNGSIEFWGLVSNLENSTYFFGASTTQTAQQYANRVQLYQGNGAGGLYLGLGTAHSQQANLETMSINTWYHIVLTWATTGSGVGNYSVFVNGSQEGSGSYSGWTAMHSFADIGNDGNASQRTEELTGSVDEVRAMNSTISLDWALTEYNNQNSPSTFYSISTEPKVWTGGTSTTFSTTTNWLNSSVPTSTAGHDVIINNGTFQPLLHANFQVNGLFVRTGATFSLSSRSFSVSGDISSCGTILGNTSTLVLNSSITPTQNISGSGTFSFTNLTIDNTFSTSPGIVLNKDINVSGTLALTSGIINTTTTNILTMGSVAICGNGSSSSHVSGPMAKVGQANFVFPVGKNGSWRRVGVSTLTSSATFRAEYFDSGFGNTSSVNAPLDNVSLFEYWQLDRTSGTTSAFVSLYWENATTSGINNCADLTIARWNGAGWDERAATSFSSSSCTGTGAGTITTTAAVTAFSPFAFGSKSTSFNPLPIELIVFEAHCDATIVSLNWATASETNNAYFGIEKSPDGIDWKEIDRLAGAGSSTSRKDYRYQDALNQQGLVYYRLKQVDVDGKQKNSDIIAVNCSNKENSMRLYPNPTDNEIHVELALLSNYTEGAIEISDQLGRKCFEQKVAVVNGLNALKFVITLPTGVYSIRFVSPETNITPQKLLIR